MKSGRIKMGDASKVERGKTSWKSDKEGEKK